MNPSDKDNVWDPTGSDVMATASDSTVIWELLYVYSEVSPNVYSKTYSQESMNCGQSAPLQDSDN